MINPFKRRQKPISITFTIPADVIKELKTQINTTDEMIEKAIVDHLNIKHFQKVSNDYEQYMNLLKKVL